MISPNASRFHQKSVKGGSAIADCYHWCHKHCSNVSLRNPASSWNLHSRKQMPYFRHAQDTHLNILANRCRLTSPSLCAAVMVIHVSLKFLWNTPQRNWLTEFQVSLVHSAVSISTSVHSRHEYFNFCRPESYSCQLLYTIWNCHKRIMYLCYHGLGTVETEMLTSLFRRHRVYAPMTVLHCINPCRKFWRHWAPLTSMEMSGAPGGGNFDEI